MRDVLEYVEAAMGLHGDIGWQIYSGFESQLDGRLVEVIVTSEKEEAPNRADIWFGCRRDSSVYKHSRSDHHAIIDDRLPGGTQSPQGSCGVP